MTPCMHSAVMVAGASVLCNHAFMIVQLRRVAHAPLTLRRRADSARSMHVETQAPGLLTNPASTGHQIYPTICRRSQPTTNGCTATWSWRRPTCSCLWQNPSRTLLPPHLGSSWSGTSSGLATSSGEMAPTSPASTHLSCVPGLLGLMAPATWVPEANCYQGGLLGPCAWLFCQLLSSFEAGHSGLPARTLACNRAVQRGLCGRPDHA